MASRIEDYALIGNCETSALVCRTGSIDWFCVPRFDSGACFASLLGGPEHGRWQIAPVGHVHAVRRRYRPGTLILETTVETTDGSVMLVDFMPLHAPSTSIVRMVVGLTGSVRMHSELVIRFDYGLVVPWVHRRDGCLVAIAGSDTLYFDTPAEHHGENLKTVSDFTVGKGDRVPFTLTWQATHLPRPETEEPDASLERTATLWTQWSERASRSGPWSEHIQRSLITLKALTYEPTGGIVAAPTTSLPEQIGGVRNWDYRYCWLRDATFTLYALMAGSYIEEARAWRDWLVRAVAGEPQKLQIMYGIAGERRLLERELKWLPGYEHSSPVRIGNAAHRQHQLDVYGEVMDALYLARRYGVDADDIAWDLQSAMLRFLQNNWQLPDCGIWEVRGPLRHFTHSKVMAWVALDRAIRSVEEFGYAGPVDDWRRCRAKIHAEVCARGFDPDLNSFVQYYGSREPDASLLMLPLVGFLPATDPRMRGTVDLICDRLVTDGFVQRYITHPHVDGLPEGEGAFLICTFWLVDNLALQGRYQEARDIFERLLGLCNDVGLLSEQYDVVTGRHLGNFPQAFSHVGLIHSARVLTATAAPG